ncbi:AAA family ATPase [Candidatus Woesearchaeota archaeon]|nr:AAA family ATPase [Candidatus Woesearchaeota archaeon]
MDGGIRRNAKAGLDENVVVRKADVKDAKSIVVAPAQKGLVIQGDPEFLKRGLIGKTVVKGDQVALGGSMRRRIKPDAMFPDILEEFGKDFEMFERSIGNLGLSVLRLIVVDVNPKQAVIITADTQVTFKPEAVEVAEEKVMDVSYEDVGGLDEEIKKVREMIEIPLKYPEIFERLGIEAPKGVLLHGPPGTGKTLLAKAVASETDSNFILINGPEIMCVSGETPIFTNPRGFVEAEKIYEEQGTKEELKGYTIKKLDHPVSTYAFKYGKIRKAKITHATKLNAEAFRLKLSDGNEITVSENQPFLIYKNGCLTWGAAKNIKRGDFVARLNKLALPEQSYKIPLRVLNEKFLIVKQNGKYAIKSRNLSRSNFVRLPENTSPELLELIGLIVSDGNISSKGDSIGFYNKNEDLIKHFNTLMGRVFGVWRFKEKNKLNMLGSIVYSKLLVEFFKLLGFSSENKETVPPYFFRLPKQELQAFIRGYFDGDGTVSMIKIKGMVYPTPVLYSINRDFLMQLQSLMLLKLGIHCKLRKHNAPKSLMHGLVVKGNEGRAKFLDIGAVSKHKLERLQEIKKVIRVKEHENIPHPSLLIEKIRAKLPYKEYRNKDCYIYKTGKATKHSLRTLYDIARKNGIADEKVQKEFGLLLREDIGWEMVGGIESVGKKELYDFTVDKDSFTCAPYFILHNSKFYGESEQNLKKKFEEAEKNAPSIIFIDEIDAIAPKREETHGEVERRVVSQLLTVMDGLKSRGKVVVIGATNRPNAIDPALRRPGRFDREIVIGVPSRKSRMEILKVHTRNMPLISTVTKIEKDKGAYQKKVDDLLERLADVTHGFVGADLAALCKEAAMNVLRMVMPGLNLREKKPINQGLLDNLCVTEQDFREALKIVRPSALREVLIDPPKVGWNDIGGMEKIKQELKEAVEWPLKYPQVFRKMGIRPPRGILLHGPPGTGKTLLAKAVAKESEANFIQVKGPSLLNKWVGETERGVRGIFEKARQSAPSIIFFDEVDALAPKRGMYMGGSHVSENIVNTLLAEMDGLEDLHDVVIIGATNRIDIIDPALLRTGRFDRLLVTEAPDIASRFEIFKIHAQGMPLVVSKEEIKGIEEELKHEETKIISKMADDEAVKQSDVNKLKHKKFSFKDLSDQGKLIYYLAYKTEGYTGSDIEAVCRESAMIALREDLKSNTVAKKHFDAAMAEIPPSLPKEVVEEYKAEQGKSLRRSKAALREKKPDYMG